MAGCCAYVTLVTNADYALGALALARSLERTGTAAPLLVMHTQSAASNAGQGLDLLASEGCRLVEVAPLPVCEGFKRRHARPALHGAAPFAKGEKPSFHDPLDNFAKLRLWELDELERAVFLDADTIAVRNLDKLFGYPEFSGAPNLYETLGDMHRLNSGVFVARPDPRTLEAMLERLDAPGAFWRRTDQTFLEAFFPDWHGLPYTCNTLQYVRFNLPELWRWPAIKLVHYQYEKPWELRGRPDHPRFAALEPLIELWWAALEGRPYPEDIPALAPAP